MNLIFWKPSISCEPQASIFLNPALLTGFTSLQMSLSISFQIHLWQKFVVQGKTCKNYCRYLLVKKFLMRTICETFSANNWLKYNLWRVCNGLLGFYCFPSSPAPSYRQRFIILTFFCLKRVFKLHEKENSGYLSPFELREALHSAGYHMNAHVLNILSHRYASKDGRIAFDDFMMCAVRLKSMIGKCDEEFRRFT